MTVAVVSPKALRLVMLVTLSLGTMANAGYCDSLSGSELLALCDTPKSNDLVYFTNFSLCAGYINGASDASQCGNTVGGFSHAQPPGTTVGQIFELFVTWMRKHPENLNVGASTLVAKALQDEYPCP